MINKYPYFSEQNNNINFNIQIIIYKIQSSQSVVINQLFKFSLKKKII